MRPGITTAPCRSTTSAPSAMRVISASGPMAIIQPSFTAMAVSSRSSHIGSAIVIMPEALQNTASGLRDSIRSMVGSLHCYWNGRLLDRCDRNHFGHRRHIAGNTENLIYWWLRDDLNNVLLPPWL